MSDTSNVKPRFNRNQDSFSRSGSFRRSPVRQTPDPHADLLAGTVETATGNPEIDSAAEAEAALAALKNKELKKSIADRIQLTTDSEYWFCVCFETRAQKEAFLQNLGLFEHGDKYLDGAVMAERLGVELPAADLSYRPAAKPDKRLNSLIKN